MSEPRAYLSADQLAAVTPWSVEAIRRMVQRGTLRRGVHYFQPAGRGSRLIFKWSAIVALIEEPDAAPSAPVAAVPAPTSNRLDVDHATEALQRLLG